MKRWGVALLGLLLLAPLLAAAVIVTLGSQAAESCGAATTGAGGVGADTSIEAALQGGAADSLTAGQRQVVARIIAEGRRRQIPTKAIVTAVTVAGAESRFRVYANDGRGGDLGADQRGVDGSLRLPHDAVGSNHGSLGVFQQQWPWWGSMRELMDPGASAGKFYAALVKVPAWESLPVTVLAQRVQRSAVPSAYARWESFATSVVAQAGAASTTATGATSAGADTSGTVTEAGLTKADTKAGFGPQAKRAAAAVRSRFGFTGAIYGYADRNIGSTNRISKHALGLAIDVMVEGDRTLGDQIAAYFAGPGYGPFAVDNVIYYHRIYNQGRGWHTYAVPEGGAPHTDHVHIDFHDKPATVAPVALEASAAPAVPAPCATTTVAAGSSGIVYPLAPGSGYTDQNNYGNDGSHWAHGHTGDDLSIACGTPVRAITAGTVVTDKSQLWAGPNFIKITTGPHSLATWYAHMQKLYVTNGQHVTAGQHIGDVGELGNAFGCHLHVEIHPHNGSIYQDGVDPHTWLAAHVGHTITVAGTPAVNFAPVVGFAGSFRLASFNLLGATHTGAASADRRIRNAVAVLARHTPDVIGFQEMQHRQAVAFHRLAGGTYARWSSPDDTENSIGWRADAFTFVRGSYLSVPYFDGHHRLMPVVWLRQRTTGQVMVFFNDHNPADTSKFPHQAMWRAAALRVEIPALNRYAAQWPTFWTGDMNDHHFTTHLGGSVMRGASADQYGHIDWLLHSPGFTFTSVATDDTPLVDASSDHPYVQATVARVGTGQQQTSVVHATSGGLPSEARWLADVRAALVGAGPYVTGQAGRVRRPALNLDIDNTALASHYAYGRAVGSTLALTRLAHGTTWRSCSTPAAGKAATISSGSSGLSATRSTASAYAPRARSRWPPASNAAEAASRGTATSSSRTSGTGDRLHRRRLRPRLQTARLRGAALVTLLCTFCFEVSAENSRRAIGLVRRQSDAT